MESNEWTAGSRDSVWDRKYSREVESSRERSGHSEMVPGGKGQIESDRKNGGTISPPGGPGIEAYKRASVPNQCLQGFLRFPKRDRGVFVTLSKVDFG